MLDLGTYHVIGYGRRYLRDSKTGLVGNSIEHAEPFETHQAAVDAARGFIATFGKRVVKRVAVQTVTIIEELIEPPVGA